MSTADKPPEKEYPDYDYCYCQVCREGFKRQSGLDPAAMQDPPANAAWRRFRYDAITGVVSMLADEVRGAKKLLTAATFPTPTISAARVGRATVHLQDDGRVWIARDRQ